MISRNKLKIVLSVVSVGLLSIVSANSHAGRSVRTDSSDGAFDFQGGFWGGDNTLFGTPGNEIRTQFKLNFGDARGSHYYTVCMSEDGFLKFVTTTTCTDSGKDRHVFYSYNLSSVPGGSTIRGIEVQLQMKVDSTSGSPKSCLELSWDGGTIFLSSPLL